MSSAQWSKVRPRHWSFPCHCRGLHSNLLEWGPVVEKRRQLHRKNRWKLSQWTQKQRTKREACQQHKVWNKWKQKDVYKAEDEGFYVLRRMEVVSSNARLFQTTDTWKTVSNAKRKVSKFFLSCIHSKSLRSVRFFNSSISIQAQQRHFMSNCSCDVVLNACNVQNSPPNKCIPRILFGNYRKEETEHNKQTRMIFLASGSRVKQHMESIAHIER